MKTLKWEEVYRQEYRDVEEPRASMARFIEKVYQPEAAAFGAWLPATSRVRTRAVGSRRRGGSGMSSLHTVPPGGRKSSANPGATQIVVERRSSMLPGENDGAGRMSQYHPRSGDALQAVLAPYFTIQNARDRHRAFAGGKSSARHVLVEHHGAGLLTGEVGAGKSTAALLTAQGYRYPRGQSQSARE